LIAGRWILTMYFDGHAQTLLQAFVPFLFSLLLFYVVAIFIHPLWAACVSLGLEMLLLQAGQIKIEKIGDPVTARDLLDIGQAFSLTGYAPVSLYVTAGLTLLALVLGWKYRRRGWRELAGRLPLALPMFLLVWVYAGAEGHVAQAAREALCRMSICYYSWNPVGNVQANGVLAHVLMTAEAVQVPQPGPHDFYVHQAPLVLKPDRPDVMMILCESCFTTSDDRFRTALHALDRHGFDPFVLLSPVYGGNTPEAEFETLTGLSSAVFPGVDYQDFHDLYRPDARTLARRFVDAGYTTLSLHNFHASFWKRNRVLPRFGFQRSIFIEDMDTTGMPADSWPPDGILYRQALKEYDALPPNQPVFMYLLTMYSHGDYVPETGDFGEADYRRRLASAVDDLLAFLDAIEAAARKKGRPLAVVIFGDHKPSLTGVFQRRHVLPADLFSSVPEAGTVPRFVLQPSYPLWKARARINAYVRLPDPAASAALARRLNDKPMFCLASELSALTEGEDDAFWMAVNAICQRSDDELAAETGNAWARYFPKPVYAERLF